MTRVGAPDDHGSMARPRCAVWICRVTTPAQTRSDVVGRLLEVEEEIRGLGVRRLALFGSFARAEGVTTEAPSPSIGPHILAEARDVVRAA